MIKKNDLEKIDNKIEKLTQLHNLHSIENVIVTISFATLILGINIYLNTSVNAIWKIAALFLIMFTIYPLILFFSTFLSHDTDAKVKTLVTIISIACLHLIGLGFLTLIGWLLSYNYFPNILEFLGITYLTPILVFLIFEFWGIFLHYWIHHFEPHLENERFYLLVNLNRSEKKIKIIGRKIFKVIFLPFTIILFVSFFIWCILITEYFQAILILIVGLLNTLFLLKLIKVNLKGRYMKKKNNNNTKQPSNKSKPKEIDYKQLFIIIALIFGIFGGLSLTADYEPEKLIYPNNSGDHLIYYDNEDIGILKINANIISDIDVIAAGTPTKIIANISYFPHNDLYNTQG
ncbi:MAG: hypothetical protein K8S13_24610 [Desulfobacula sp.]|uniref:hypothetical protein n=1 Tax=Desulfobacula sp. TaxID=2593537 RepID=UPI0025BA6934|nr:hypothetical protein [Desulfobacula sp.]MCD4723012.1 hypothetical protein [Desulfobacula sp.]